MKLKVYLLTKAGGKRAIIKGGLNLDQHNNAINKAKFYNICYCLCTSGKAVLMSDPLPKLCLLTLVTVCVLQAKQ